MMKKMIFSVVLCLSIFALPLTAYAGEVDPSVKIYDYMNVLTEDEISILSQLAQSIAAEYSMDIAAVITDDANGKTSIQYADDFFDNNGFGIGANFDGLLLLINMEDGEIWISTSGYAIDVFSDGDINYTLECIIDFISDEDYYGGVDEFLQVSAKLISSYNTYVEQNSSAPVYDYNEDYHDYVSPDYQPIKTTSERIISALFPAFLVAFIISLIAILVMIKKNKMVHTSTNADYYMDKQSAAITESRDTYIRTNISKVRINTDPPSGSSGGGVRHSSTHSSSSGRSHGGGGRRF